MVPGDCGKHWPQHEVMSLAFLQKTITHTVSNFACIRKPRIRSLILPSCTPPGSWKFSHAAACRVHPHHSEVRFEVVKEIQFNELWPSHSTFCLLCGSHLTKEHVSHSEKKMSNSYRVLLMQFQQWLYICVWYTGFAWRSNCFPKLDANNFIYSIHSSGENSLLKASLSWTMDFTLLLCNAHTVHRMASHDPLDPARSDVIIRQQHY